MKAPPTRYMLDTTTASYIIKGKDDKIKENVIAHQGDILCISSITHAELLHGVAKKNNPPQLSRLVKEFLMRVEILSWGIDVSKYYADLRTTCEKHGTNLSALDMLIAAHSLATEAVLVTSDKAFYKIKHNLRLRDWTKQEIAASQSI